MTYRQKESKIEGKRKVIKRKREEREIEEEKEIYI